ncbi:MAG TPA: hypothetical protein PKC25_10220, partial [Candidatus Rifleibacterium sp.]|nr:hypothetical protein [Candidatus Rifleibacterium sp.]
MKKNKHAISLDSRGLPAGKPDGITSVGADINAPQLPGLCLKPLEADTTVEHFYQPILLLAFGSVFAKFIAG